MNTSGKQHLTAFERCFRLCDGSRFESRDAALGEFHQMMVNEEKDWENVLHVLHSQLLPTNSEDARINSDIPALPEVCELSTGENRTRKPRNPRARRIQPTKVSANISSRPHKSSEVGVVNRVDAVGFKTEMKTQSLPSESTAGTEKSDTRQDSFSETEAILDSRDLEFMTVCASIHASAILHGFTWQSQGVLPELTTLLTYYSKTRSRSWLWSYVESREAYISRVFCSLWKHRVYAFPARAQLVLAKILIASDRDEMGPNILSLVQEHLADEDVYEQDSKLHPSLRNGIEEGGWVSSSPKLYQSPPRLVSNLEVSWDRFLLAEGKFLGRIDSATVGCIDYKEVHSLVLELHPSNIDAFSARILEHLASIISRRQDLLDQAMEGRYQRGQKQRHSSGIVIHRIPESVRLFFEGNIYENFFFCFFQAVDSFRLAMACQARLSGALRDCSAALLSLSECPSSKTLLKGIIRCRLLAKFVSQFNHTWNWSHGNMVVEGLIGQAGAVYPLHETQLHARAGICNASWTAQIDLVHTISEYYAKDSVFSLLAWCAPMLNIASTDPVAPLTHWYRESILALKRISWTYRNILDRGEGKVGHLLCLLMTDSLEVGLMPSQAEALNFDGKGLCGIDSQSHLFEDPSLVETVLPDMAHLLREANNVLRRASSCKDGSFSKRVLPVRLRSQLIASSDEKLKSSAQERLDSRLLEEFFKHESPNFLELVKLAITAAFLHSKDPELCKEHARTLVERCVGPLLPEMRLPRSKLRVAAEFAANEARNRALQRREATRSIVAGLYSRYLQIATKSDGSGNSGP